MLSVLGSGYTFFILPLQYCFKIKIWHIHRGQKANREDGWHVKFFVTRPLLTCLLHLLSFPPCPPLNSEVTLHVFPGVQCSPSSACMAPVPACPTHPIPVPLHFKCPAGSFSCLLSSHESVTLPHTAGFSHSSTEV